MEPDIIIPRELYERLLVILRDYWFEYDEHSTQYNNDPVIAITKELEQYR